MLSDPGLLPDPRLGSSPGFLRLRARRVAIAINDERNLDDFFGSPARYAEEVGASRTYFHGLSPLSSANCSCPRPAIASGALGSTLVRAHSNANPLHPFHPPG